MRTVVADSTVGGAAWCAKSHVGWSTATETCHRDTQEIRTWMDRGIVWKKKKTCNFVSSNKVTENHQLLSDDNIFYIKYKPFSCIKRKWNFFHYCNYTVNKLIACGGEVSRFLWSRLIVQHWQLNIDIWVADLTIQRTGFWSILL